MDSSLKDGGQTLKYRGLHHPWKKLQSLWIIPLSLHGIDLNKPFVRNKYLHASVPPCRPCLLGHKEGVSEEMVLDLPVSQHSVISP